MSEPEDDTPQAMPRFQTRIFIDPDGTVVFENLAEELLPLVEALAPDSALALACRREPGEGGALGDGTAARAEASEPAAPTETETETETRPQAEADEVTSDDCQEGAAGPPGSVPRE